MDSNPDRPARSPSVYRFQALLVSVLRVKVVSLTPRPFCSQGKFLGARWVGGWEDLCNEKRTLSPGVQPVASRNVKSKHETNILKAIIT
jgi:hypothetical protein